MNVAALFIALFSPLSLLYSQAYDTVWVASVEARVMTAVNAGDLPKGNNLCLLALDTARAHYGAESREATELLVGISDYQKFMGDFQAAEQTVTTCLNNWKKLLGEQNVKVAEALHSLGLIRFRLRQFDKVEKLLTDAKQMFIDLGLAPSVQLCFIDSDLAAYYESQGLFLKAEQSHLEALRAAKAVPGMASELHGILLNNMAVFYNTQQRSTQALQIQDNYLKILENIYDKSHPFYLKSLVNKGIMLMEAGQYKESQSLLEYTLGIARTTLSRNVAQLSFCLRSLAMLYQRIGQYEEAIQLEEESMALLKNQYGTAYPAYSDNLVRLATLLKYVNRLAQADTLLREAVQILERENRTGEIGYASTLTSLGSLYQMEQRFSLAGPLLEKGAQLGGERLGTENPAYYLRFGKSLVLQYLLENRPDSALHLLNTFQSPILNAYGKSHQLYITLETQYGKVWQLKGDANRALQHFSAAFTGLKANLAENFRFLSINEREKFARTFEDFRTAFLSSARAFPNDENIRTFLYDLSIFQKELLASYDRQLLAGWQQNADSTYRDYTEIRRMIAKQWTLPAQERLDLPELETRRKALEKTLAVQSAMTDALRPVGWQQVQQTLQTGDAALEWLNLPPAQVGVGAPCYAVLVLRPGLNTPELILLQEVAGINALFTSNSSRGLQYATRTYTDDALYRALWLPLEARLVGVQRIFYAPTGALHLLNFDAIQAADGQLLSEKYRLVRVTNTARLLDAGFGKNLAGVSSALLTGGLDYESATQSDVTKSQNLVSRGASWRGGDRSPVREWAALPNTLPEVERLTALLQKKKVQTSLLTGSNGSETAIKAQCDAAAPGILHFATHGFFFEKNTTAPGSLGIVAAENPMFRSGLILAGANPAWRGEPAADTSDDGILTADEISLLSLRNTALVVLSACETGLGDVHDDEGVYGLQRAFRLAGVQNIVMSLWRVPDVQTRQFMEKLYTALLDQGDIRGAFQNARQAMRKDYRNPYYWAGFVLLE